MTNVLRMERCNLFAHAPYGSVEKSWKAWAMSPVLAVFSDKSFPFFFIFTTLGEEILEIEHDPQQLWPMLNTCLNSYICLQFTAAHIAMAMPPKT